MDAWINRYKNWIVVMQVALREALRPQKTPLTFQQRL